MGFVPLLIDPDQMMVFYQLPFGFDSLGVIIEPGISRQIPSLAGNVSFVQFFQSAPFVFSSNALRFDIVP